jgi:hypothetical protein
MTIGLVPAVPFVDDTSTISATTANTWRANMAKALDRVGGSGGVAETPSTVIDIAGAGLKISGSGAAARLQYASTSEVRTQRSFLLNNDTGAVKVGFITLSTPGEQGMQCLVMPDGCTLASVTVYHNRVDTGVMPANRVQMSVWKINITTGTVTQLGVTTVDPTASLAAYEAHHGFSISTIGEVIDNETCIYYVLVDGESGANASPTVWYGSRVTITVTSQDKAP